MTKTSELMPIVATNYWHTQLPPSALSKQFAKGLRITPKVEVIWSFKNSLFQELIVINGIAYSSIPMLCFQRDDQYSLIILSREVAERKILLIREHDSALFFERTKLPLQYFASPRRLRWRVYSPFADKPDDLGWGRCCGACKAIHRFLHLSSIDGICCGGVC